MAETIEGTSQGESIFGTANDDVINARGGNDFVLGLAGNDQIDAGGGNDKVVGGDGDDTITGGAGTDKLVGEAGDDTLTGGPGSDALAGGAGADTFVISGTDTILDFNPDEGDKIEGTIEGTARGESIFGTANDDVISARGGNDFVLGQAGNDQIDAGGGNDNVVSGDGDDTITGGAGSDKLAGEAGADTFVFDPAHKEGADTIIDLNPDEGDKIAFSADGLATSGIDPNDFSAASLDESDKFQLGANNDGDVEITYPGGTIALHGVTFTEGLTFAELGANDLFEVSRLIEGTAQADTLTGTDGNDVIDAKGGNDIITPGSGDDTITTGAGRDQVNIDPSNPNEGHDTITDFSAPGGLNPTAGDSLAFKLADILAADPALPAADGDASSLSLDDLDASGNWTLSAASDGNLLFTHPGGSVEFSDIAFTDQHFADLGSAILVDGREFTSPIPVESSATGGQAGGEQTTTSSEQTTSGEQTTNSQQTTSGEQTTNGEQTTSGEQTTNSQQTTGGEQATNSEATGGDHAAGGEESASSDGSTDTEHQVADAGHIGEGAIA
jgi:Ca2+-binding RTX toxin-like protein